MIAQEAKPCPFCGRTPQWRLVKMGYDQLHGEPMQDHSLGCVIPSCFVRPVIQGSNKERLLKSWNTRIVNPVIPSKNKY
jgi:hypothetical protein